MGLLLLTHFCIFRSHLGMPIKSEIIDRLFETNLGPFRDHFGTILGPLWDYFGTTLGPFWDHFGTLLILTFCYERGGQRPPKGPEGPLSPPQELEGRARSALNF